MVGTAAQDTPTEAPRILQKSECFQCVADQRGDQLHALRSAFDTVTLGRTIGSLAFTTSQYSHQQGFFTTMQGVTHTPDPNTYRPLLDDDDRGKAVLSYQENALFQSKVPPSEVAGILIELFKIEAATVEKICRTRSQVAILHHGLLSGKTHQEPGKGRVFDEGILTTKWKGLQSAQRVCIWLQAGIPKYTHVNKPI